MTDPTKLHAQVVELLQRGEAGFGPAKVALVAIAERHAPDDYYGTCTRCDVSGRGEIDYNDSGTPWPCPDFRDVAAAAGIAMPGG